MFAWISSHTEVIWLCVGILLNLSGILLNLLRFRRTGLSPETVLQLVRAMCLFEAEAERLPDLSPAEKLEYVLDRLRRLTEEMGCAFEEAAWSAQIERDMSKDDGCAAGGRAANDSAESGGADAEERDDRGV